MMSDACAVHDGATEDGRLSGAAPAHTCILDLTNRLCIAHMCCTAPRCT